MITLAGLLALALCCIGVAADKLQGDESPRAAEQTTGFDALIFMLCLAGILYKRRKDREDEDF